MENLVHTDTLTFVAVVEFAERIKMYRGGKFTRTRTRTPAVERRPVIRPVKQVDRFCPEKAHAPKTYLVLDKRRGRRGSRYVSVTQPASLRTRISFDSQSCSFEFRNCLLRVTHVSVWPLSSFNGCHIPYL